MLVAASFGTGVFGLTYHPVDSFFLSIDVMIIWLSHSAISLHIGKASSTTERTTVSIEKSYKSLVIWLFLFGNFLYALPYCKAFTIDLPKDENDRHQVISATRLRPAIVRALDVLGASALDHILYELEKNGVAFREGKSYTPYQIEQVMEALFGKEAAALIIERVLSELNKTD